MTDEPIPSVAERVLAPLSEIDDADLVRLRADFVRRAHDEDLLDIAYRVVDSPVGHLLLAATRRGLLRVAFEMEDHDVVLSTLASRLSPRVLEDRGALDDAARQLEEYFAGIRDHFELELDLALTSGFRRVVIEHLARIPYGTTQSYGEVASHVGNPGAVRAVGSACATNPLPLVVPCHRVLRSDGSLGGYLAGLPTKRALLELEGVA